MTEKKKLNTTPLTYLEHKILMKALRLIENPSFETWCEHRLLALIESEERLYDITPRTTENMVDQAIFGAPSRKKPEELEGGLIDKGYLIKEPTGHLILFNWPSVEHLMKTAAKTAPDYKS
jgi:hypothetical protein